MSLIEKLEKLSKMVEEQQIERLRLNKLDCEGNIIGCKTKIIDGLKYVKIDVGSSGKLMIEKLTEKIYGIKAYGQVHKGHQYGTLDTIENYYWGDYYPQLKKS